MIAWTKFFKHGEAKVALGLHDTGVCCVMDNDMDSPKIRIAYAHVLINREMAMSKIFVGNAGTVTEALDEYITTHKDDYMYEWPDNFEDRIKTIGYKEYTP